MNHETKPFVTPEQQNTLFYSVKTQKSQEAILLKETPLFSQISIHVANSCSIYSNVCRKGRGDLHCTTFGILTRNFGKKVFNDNVQKMSEF